MKKHWVAPWAVAGLLMLSSVALLRAQTEPDPRLAGNVAGIHEALDRLVLLLETMQHDQRVSLLIERIALKERRLAPLEDRLRRAENDVQGSQDERIHLQARKKQLEELREEAVRTGAETEADEARRMVEELDGILEALVERQDDARRRVMRYEDELAEGREEIEILDELLLEMVGED